MRLTKKTIDGRTIRYRDWRAEVVRLADDLNVPEAIRDQVTEPMLKDGWDRNERPEAFLAKCVESLS